MHIKKDGGSKKKKKKNSNNKQFLNFSILSIDKSGNDDDNY